MTPVTFREVRKYVRGDVQAEVVVRAASQLRMKLIESAGELMTFRVRLNAWSYGERVTVALGSVSGARLVDITSSLIASWQVVDWGKNQQNVRRLFEQIEKELGDGCEHVQCRLCRECEYLLVDSESEICPECGYKQSPSDGPPRREVAPFRTAMRLAVLNTLFGIALMALDDRFGILGFSISQYLNARGVVFLFCVSFVTVFGILRLHRLVKPYVERR